MAIRRRPQTEVMSGNLYMEEGKKKPSPYFYRPRNSCVVLVTEEYDEFGDLKRTGTHLSERSAKRLLDELTKAIESK